MKLNKYIGLAALAVAFTACQDDMLEGNKQQNSIYTLSGKIGGGAAMSRAQIDFDNADKTKEAFMWNERDSFALYQGRDYSWIKSVFTKSSESGTDKKTATFSTKTPAIEGSYVAVYPANYDVDGNIINFDMKNTLDFSNGVDPNDVWSSYFQNNMIMMSLGTLNETGENIVTFQHMMSLFRISYTNQSDSDQEIEGITLGSEDCSIEFGHYPYISLDWNDYSIGSSYYSDSYELITNGLTVAAGDTCDFYVLFCPSNFNVNDLLHIHLNFKDGRKTVKLATSDIVKANNGYIGFDSGKRYWFHLTGDDKGLYFSKEYTTDVVTIENPGLSLALKDVLENEGISVELDSITGHASIMKMDANRVTNLEIQNPNGQNPLKYTVTSLDGIGNFPNLQYLTCRNTGLETCDLSENTQLLWVDFYWNNLTELDLNSLLDLEFVSVGGNYEMTTLKIDSCENLVRVDCRHNKLMTSVTIQHPEKITELSYGDTQMSFDLTQFTNLETLVAEGIGLDTLALPKSSKDKISQLLVSNNNLESIDLSEYPKLWSFDCSNNNFKTLDLSKAANLSSLNCEYNYLDTLDISNTKIGDPNFTLKCGSQKDNISLVLELTEEQKKVWDDEGWGQYNINVSLKVVEAEDVLDVVTIKNDELTAALRAVLGSDTVAIDPDYGYGIIDGNIVLEIEELNFNRYEGTITSLKNGIEFFENLTKLECRDVKLQTCDLSYNTKLTYVDVQSNELAELNLKGCANLEQLFCQSNSQLKSLDLDGCTKLRNFQAHGTGLTTLDIPNPSAMDNMLLPTDVPITTWTDWETFASMFSSLTGLGLQNKKNVKLDDMPQTLRERLTYLNVNQTELTALDLGLFPNLTALDCEWNSITTLDLTKATGLQTLHCMGNQITELDITSLYALGYLNCGSQDIEGELTLKMTSEQKSKWTNEWSNNGCNNDVTPEVVTTAGGGIIIVE